MRRSRLMSRSTVSGARNGKTTSGCLGGGIDEPQRAERGERRAACSRRLEQLLARVGVLAATAREVDVVRGLVPGALQLGQEVRARRDRRAACRAGRARRSRAARRSSRPRAPARPRAARSRDRPSRVERCDDELEVAQIDDLVAPELHAHGVGHAERVHVEDAAAQTELRDVLDHRHALEADALEMRPRARAGGGRRPSEARCADPRARRAAAYARAARAAS